jgi:hypothetical protein
MKILLCIVSLLMFPLSPARSAVCRAAELKVEAIDHSERIIYHSPETPGYTSWVGMWQLPKGMIQCDFIQATGPRNNPELSFPVLETIDAGKTWTHAADNVAAGWTRGSAVLPNRTMVRPDARGLYFDADGILQYPNNNFMGVCRSTDGGVTWGESINLVSPAEYKLCLPTVVRLLKDGRLAAFGAMSITAASEGLTKMLFISSDEGKSWGKPIVVMPFEVGVCEESDFCELPNGDLFFIHRTGHYLDHATDRAASPLVAKMGPNPPESYCYSDRMQSIIRKQGETFVAGECEPAPFPHSGFPAVLYTQEGLILHLATDGVYWTADVGKTWNRLDIPGTPYYPQVLQMKDGTVVVVGHLGSDDKYGTVNQSVKQQIFRLRVVGSS